MAINSTKNEKHDMLTNKNSKFLFYNFNNYFDRQIQPVESVRHTIISEGKHGLLELQRKDWLNFIENVIEMPEKENFELENEGDDIDF